MMLIGQTDMFQPEAPLGLRGRVGDQRNMSSFHQGQEADKILHIQAEYKRAVDPFMIMPCKPGGVHISGALAAINQGFLNNLFHWIASLRSQ